MMMRGRIFATGVVLAIAATIAWGQPERIDTLTIERAVELALKYHPSLRSAEANVRAAAAGYRLAVSSYYPSLSFVGSATHTEGVFVSNPLFPARSQIYSNYSGNLQAQLTLYDFGKTSNRVGANTDLTDAAGADFTASRELVKLNAQVAYVGLLAARKVVVVNQEAVAQATKHLSQAKAFYTAGRRPQFDVTNAEVDLANANVNLIRAVNLLRVGKVQLENAMGVHPSGEYVIVEEIQIPPFTAGIDSVVGVALQVRPEIQAARARLEAARSLTRSTWSQHLPTLSAVGNWSWNGFQPSPLYPRWNGGLQLSLPIFQGFAISAQVEQAEANSAAAQAALDTETEAVRLEVEQSFLAMKEAEERRVAAAKLVEQAEANLNIAERQYAAGVGTPLEVTDAQLTRSNAQIVNIQALYDTITSIVRLRRAMGVTTP
jgi:outer membrane protein TolC